MCDAYVIPRYGRYAPELRPDNDDYMGQQYSVILPEYAADLFHVEDQNDCLVSETIPVIILHGGDSTQAQFGLNHKIALPFSLPFQRVRSVEMLDDLVHDCYGT